MTTRLQDLAEKLSKSERDDTDRNRLWIGVSKSGVLLEFFGNPADTPFQELCSALSEASIAPTVGSLILRGPDEGANGTCNWDLECLASSSTDYLRLKTFTVEQGRPGDHNSHIIGEVYEENGVLGRLLEKMPSLEVFASPSAPNQNFFRTEARPLRFISVNAGIAHQDFVRNLASATNLRELRTLEYGEASGPGFEGIERTSVEAYASLFRSTSVRPHCVVLRNPSLSEGELRELKALRPDLQLLVVRCEASHVR
jgi:hypothetical protein